jgi:hypothetical protein
MPIQNLIKNTLLKIIPSMKNSIQSISLFLFLSLSITACSFDLIKPLKEFISNATESPQLNQPNVQKTLIPPDREFPSFSEFQKGIAYTSWWQGEYSSAESDFTISKIIKPLGANWISVVVTCYQQYTYSTQIMCEPDAGTPSDDDLIHVIQFIHSQGMKVMLKPHVDIVTDGPGHWRGNIGFGNNEEDWQVWFNEYTDFIIHYAKLAQENQVDYFVIGTELGKTSNRVENWQTIIRKIRRVFNGPITYAANWDEVFDVSWWNELDAIGVDAYFSLTNTNDPTINQLKEAWEPITNQLGDFSKLWDLPIILTEIGYRSRDGANRRASDTQTIDLQEQADCYQAFFESFSGKDWWEGVYWWNWTIDPNQGGLEDNDFTANGKPAEEVLKFYFGAQ